MFLGISPSVNAHVESEARSSVVAIFFMFFLKVNLFNRLYYRKIR
jgi:hypothetical protein